MQQDERVLSWTSCNDTDEDAIDFDDDAIGFDTLPDPYLKHFNSKSKALGSENHRRFPLPTPLSIWKNSSNRSRNPTSRPTDPWASVRSWRRALLRSVVGGSGLVSFLQLNLFLDI